MDLYIKDFKELTVEELYKILKLRSEVFVVEQNCIYEDCDNKDIDARHLLAVENNEVVGYLRILNRGVSYSEVSIGRVLTNKNNRCTGIGKKCMLTAIDYIKNTMNEKRIRISAQEYAVSFYSGVGFEIASEVYREDDIPHIEMVFNEN